MPSAHSLWLVVFCFSFRIFLLKLVLARWCLDAVSMSSVLQFAVIWGADVVSFGVQNLLFGILVASTLAPLGSIEIQEDFGAQAGRPWGPGFIDF